MNPYVHQVESIVRATRIAAGDVYWFGRRLTRPLPRRFAQVIPGAGRQWRVTALQDRLYADFYCQGRAAPVERRPHGTFDANRALQLMAELSHANVGAGGIEGGWEIRRIAGQMLVVARGGVEIVARRDECEFARDSPATVGGVVGLRRPKEMMGRLPGFYVASGDRQLSDAADARLVRMYWNLTSRGAVQLMRLVTSLFNAEDMPFELKVLVEIGEAPRADGVVLYFPRSSSREAIAIAERIYADVAGQLRPAVPALTKVLAPGLALAEDPGGGVSFGEHRCRLLAAALIDSHAEAGRSPQARLASVIESLASNGVSIERPYLNGNSDDIYFSALSAALPADRPAKSFIPAHDETPGRWLTVAERIADRICRDAAWDGGQCSWMGAGLADDGAATYGSLGPQLYSGTSGVALFLAEMANAINNKVARRTALGAMRHAFSRVESIEFDERRGLFTGWTGIALAAARVAELLDEESLRSQAAGLLNKIVPRRSKRAACDLISGAAGAIVGWLASRALIGDQALAAAIELGDELLSTAERTARGWSWRSESHASDLNLTGLSHGAAGVGWSLLELYHASGESRYRTAADMAFAYERRWFDSTLGNWRDLRGYPKRGTRRDDPLPCSAYWCHGAPGIALSRLRAFQITGERIYRAEAITALETTASVTARALEGRMNFSLCHGVAGNAAVLLEGARSLAREVPQASVVASLVAAQGVERYEAEESWPSGAGASTPGLMIGLAGVGHFYLRLARPATPSVLRIDVDAFVRGHVGAAILPAFRADPVAAVAIRR